MLMELEDVIYVRSLLYVQIYYVHVVRVSLEEDQRLVHTTIGI